MAAVWGQMSTGGGHAHLREAMSVLGVPTMTTSWQLSPPLTNVGGSPLMNR